MGAQLGPGPSGGGGRRIRRPPMSEINVTPFVDVMLVLLIIFMVTAPLLTVGVPVNLPQTDAAQLQDAEEPLVVSVDGEGRVFLQETEVDLGTLPARLAAITAANPETVIYVRGDRAISYGQIMTVMGALSSAGFSRLALVGEMPDGRGQ